MKRASILTWIACLLLVGIAAGAQDQNQGFLTVRELLQSSCAACHDWAASYEGITDPSRVTPGSPEKSSLYTRVADDSMPMGGQPLSVTQKNLLRAWIAAGATASEEPLAVTLPEGTSAEAGAAAAAPPPPAPKRFNKVKFHQVSGFTSASLFLAAGAAGAVQFGTLMTESHAYRDANNIDEDQISTKCANYIMGLWKDPMHQALRWTHVGLLTAGESLYLANAITGWSMRTHRPGLTPQNLHRYAFFIHGSLMVAEIIMGAFTTEALSSGNHWAVVGLGISHIAVGFTIPVVMIGSGLAIDCSLRRK